ncbi:hypothetical protein [Mesorhizobium sp. J428]|uniref:hypothetical protein n=1 Tax=Mesorhizobium sp. J428 TaxID=2898440 RepID=UPI002151698E|nr:hypothetical protein [Mesorhizobium sp. J428]MCR5859302.1 hypothetical protein [Mesorhizobium sp. J428]
MSDDPETLRQIEELSHDDRPLLVLDVDDVLLDFIRPFPRYLEGRGYKLNLDNFRLNGNIVELASGAPADTAQVAELIDAFFVAQSDWQTLTEGAAEALEFIGARAEIILLTAMPHRHRASRIAHLDALGFSYPLLTTEMAKGPAIERLRGPSMRPVAFVDDQPRNLASAMERVPDAHLFHLMADNSLRALIPPPPAGVHIVDDWREAAPKIASALGL